jgi:hypothetical protein
MAAHHTAAPWFVDARGQQMRRQQERKAAEHVRGSAGAAHAECLHGLLELASAQQMSAVVQLDLVF